jgi:hypothetical protein
MYQWTGGGGPPEFDQALADSYVGKYILVGITYLDSNGALVERVQLHGVIEAATPNGIEISLRGKRAGEVWTMPPTLDAISAAPPGQYSLKSSDEVVDDPDLLSTWTVTKPPEH